MKVREATAEDRAAWNAFADDEGGHFRHYLEWKNVHEARGQEYIPLLVENDASGIIGILPIIREKKYLSTILHSDTAAGGLLMKRELPDTQRYEAISALLKYVDTNYSKRCSRFTFRENLLPINEVSEEPTAALIDSGCHFRYDVLNHVPCTFIMELKPPFEENIWNGLWSSKVRNKLKKAKSTGVVVIDDKEFRYVDEFIDMFYENCRRHGTIPYATKGQIKAEINTFRDKAKLFVALLDDRPIVAQLSYYTASTCFLWEIGSYGKETGRANMLCDVAAIKDACNTGYKFVDFGFTETSSLADHKEQLKGTRIPFRMYEKRYSVPRSLVELVFIVLNKAWHDKAYLWKQRRELWGRIVRW